MLSAGNLGDDVIKRNRPFDEVVLQIRFNHDLFTKGAFDGKAAGIDLRFDCLDNDALPPILWAWFFCLDADPSVPLTLHALALCWRLLRKLKERVAH